MFGKRCTLCGGKLDRNKICTECGLNNSRSEKNYRINQSSCDGMPLTHVHGDGGDGQERQKKIRSRERRNAGRSRRKRTDPAGMTRRVVIAVIVFMIVGSLAGSISNLLSDLFSGSDEPAGGRENPYEELEESGYTFSETGETVELELPSGRYTVGVNIPEGQYSARTQNDFDVIRVQDFEHQIYLYEYKGNEEGNYLDDLRLPDGAQVIVNAEAPVTLSTENAQPVRGMENPNTESFTLTTGQGTGQRAVAGPDFAPGVYDLAVTEGRGIVAVKILDENGEEYSTEQMYLGEGNSYGAEYRNCILPENAVISLVDYGEDDEEVTGEENRKKFTVTMTPSPWIESEDYLQDHMRYR